MRYLHSTSLTRLLDTAAAKMDEGGKIAPSDELARDIAVGAIKYATLRGSILQDSVLIKNKHVSFEGDSGPYLMYAHARIASILNKAKEAGMTPSTSVLADVPYELEKVVYQFPEVVRKAQNERAPHLLVTYLTALASAFNAFYAHEQIVDAKDANAPFKLALASAVGTTLRNGLHILGMSAPERM
jgi:arginyl-tRNA synthetase